MNTDTQFGLSQSTISAIQSVFAAYTCVDKVVIYGSRAKGNYKNGSDIDLTMYGTITHPLHLAIFDDLDELMLPYTIDLSVFNALNHAPLQAHIERVGIVFYEKSKQETKDLRLS